MENKDLKKIIKDSVRVLLDDDKENIQAILLFGSQVNNKAIWRSDIDLCVVFKKELNIKKATLFRKRMLGLLPTKVDLQVFNNLPLKIKKSIADNHKVIFRSTDFDEFGFVKRNRVLSMELKRRIAAVGI